MKYNYNRVLGKLYLLSIVLIFSVRKKNILLSVSWWKLSLLNKTKTFEIFYNTTYSKLVKNKCGLLNIPINQNFLLLKWANPYLIPKLWQCNYEDAWTPLFPLMHFMNMYRSIGFFHCNGLADHLPCFQIRVCQNFLYPNLPFPLAHS